MARNFARGAPPPPGSIEYVAVGDMWDPEIAARKFRAARSQSGFQVYEISFTDLDAAENYVAAIDRSVKQARRVHGDQILSRQDERDWDELATRFRTFAADMHLTPGSPAMMQKENKRMFDELVGNAHRLAEGFAGKGMSPVPVPYAGELLLLLRSMPKQMTAADMQAKLLAGAKCGDRMLDENTTWWNWISGRDHLPLKRAVAAARTAADLYGRSRVAPTKYRPGSPVYDEFLRRLTRIWIEAAGLYGIRTTGDTARAELKDDVRKMPETATAYLLGLLALAGVGYLGAGWLKRQARPTVVGVPDAYPEDLDESVY
jgi:hypothetical protein